MRRAYDRGLETLLQKSGPKIAHSTCTVIHYVVLGLSGRVADTIEHQSCLATTVSCGSSSLHEGTTASMLMMKRMLLLLEHALLLSIEV
jgi:hypothetical protein